MWEEWREGGMEGQIKMTQRRQSQNICLNKRTAATHEEEAESCPIPSKKKKKKFTLLFLEERLMKYSQAAMQDIATANSTRASLAQSVQ